MHRKLHVAAPAVRLTDHHYSAAVESIVVAAKAIIFWMDGRMDGRTDE
jgi:hypothetical protein